MGKAIRVRVFEVVSRAVREGIERVCQARMLSGDDADALVDAVIAELAEVLEL